MNKFGTSWRCSKWKIVYWWLCTLMSLFVHYSGLSHAVVFRTIEVFKKYVSFFSFISLPQNNSMVVLILYVPKHRGFYGCNISKSELWFTSFPFGSVEGTFVTYSYLAFSYQNYQYSKWGFPCALWAFRSNSRRVTSIAYINISYINIWHAKNCSTKQTTTHKRGSVTRCFETNLANLLYQIMLKGVLFIPTT